ncbi:unnamed protein product [Phytomonas sp. EM1]|nr:unnamed protein product [Phytomonas sp. EM1]|eukprot:CCW64190.1 unnamed protein product [Phytomonas sp. isolate EM1]
MVYSFASDYSEGCHPSILEALAAMNFEQNPGYGVDKHTMEAAAMIREIVQQPNADVHLMVGGTMVNSIAIDLALRPYEAVISPTTGHINTLETGCAERFGHKILTTEGVNGKLTAERIDSILKSYDCVHMPVPKLVYITNTTEIGTIYTKEELSEVSQFCRQNGLYLFMDGARLPSALMASGNDLTLPDIASMVDAFTIGLGKSGALFGEALVIMHDNLKPGARHLIKQHAGLLSKGWLIGVQFKALLHDNIYLKLAEHANRTAMILKRGIQSCGYAFWTDSMTNIQFPILPPHVVKQLDEHFASHVEKVLPHGGMVVRFCTSWATKEEECVRFVEMLREITNKGQN